MAMNDYAARLARGAETIAALARGLSAEQARWRPAPGEWSALEIVNHLYDEEREDFRVRLRLTLEDPSQDWPPIDPEGWAVQRAYNERDLDESLAAFLGEREASLAWLRSLQAPNWDQARRHPAGFTLRAGDLLAAWVAHDLLHIRQLAATHWAYVAQAAAPYSVEYAGS